MEFAVLTRLTLQVFAQRVMGMLTSDLGLAAEESDRKDKQGQVQEIRIESQTGMRNSKILPGSRETLDSDFDLSGQTTASELRASLRRYGRDSRATDASNWRQRPLIRRLLSASAGALTSLLMLR